MAKLVKKRKVIEFSPNIFFEILNLIILTFILKIHSSPRESRIFSHFDILCEPEKKIKEYEVENKQLENAIHKYELQVEQLMSLNNELKVDLSYSCLVYSSLNSFYLFKLNGIEKDSRVLKLENLINKMQSEVSELNVLKLHME